jgi:hypothetical protein
MTSCTVLIPHVDTPYYLKVCLEQVRKYRHPEVEQKVIVVDQSGNSTCKDSFESADVCVVQAPRIDAGYPIDLGAKMADTDYFCTLDCDAFPIHRNWLRYPIALIEKYGFSFVGNNTGLDQSYKDKGAFFHINNYFRVSKTSVVKDLSEVVGFMRVGNRHKVGYHPKDTSWGDLACDNGVVAQWYADQKGYGPKISLPVTSHVGCTPKMGIYGMVVDDLVFHMVFGYGQEWIADMQDVLGSDYLALREKMMAGALNEGVINDLISKSVKRNDPYVTYGNLLKT